MRQGEIGIRLEFTMALHCVRNVIVNTRIEWDSFNWYDVSMAQLNIVLVLSRVRFDVQLNTVAIVYVGVAFATSKSKMKIRWRSHFEFSLFSLHSAELR